VLLRGRFNKNIISYDLRQWKNSTPSLDSPAQLINTRQRETKKWAAEAPPQNDRQHSHSLSVQQPPTSMYFVIFFAIFLHFLEQAAILNWGAALWL
jgi:hypothetical protein